MHQSPINADLIKRLLKQNLKKQVSKSQQKISQQQTTKLTNKIALQIDNGQLSIANPHGDFQNYINHSTKKEALKNIQKSQDFNNYERDLRIMKGMTASQIESHIPKKKLNRKKSIQPKQQVIQNKKSEKQIKKEFLAKVKQWEEERAKILKKKNQIEMRKKSLEISSEEKNKKEKEEINAFLKLEKKKIIEAKLKQIEQRKARRLQNLKQSSVKKIDSSPKYVEAEKRFKSVQLQKQLQNKIILKNRKEELQIKMEEIKKHEKQYIQRIKKRLNMRSQNANSNHSNDSISKSIQSFSVHKKDPIQMKKIEQKIKRIKKIQNKIRLMPLKIDPEKQKEIQILGDKLKNKKKYHFLSQKALSDEQIYQEFKDFDINIDNRQLGNQYFQELKSINQQLGKRKVTSQKVLPATKPEYKDYMKQIREKRKSILNPDQFASVAKKISNSKGKTAGKNYLLAKSEQFQQKVMEQIYELKKMDKYSDAVKKQEEIDKNYMKAIQAKLALVKMQ